MTEFRAEADRQVNNIRRAENIIDTLDIDAKHKYLFMRLNDIRGIQTLNKFKEQLEEIYENSTDIIELFLEDKKIGIESLYVIATQMTPKNQAIYFEAVSTMGVKRSEHIFSNCIDGTTPVGLFDSYYYGE